MSENETIMMGDPKDDIQMTCHQTQLLQGALLIIGAKKMSDFTLTKLSSLLRPQLKSAFLTVGARKLSDCTLTKLS